MFNKLKAALLLQLFATSFSARITNISSNLSSGVTVGEAVHQSAEFPTNASIFVFNSATGNFVFGNSKGASNIPPANKLGFFSVTNGIMDATCPFLAGATSTIFTDPGCVRTFDVNAAGSTVFVSAGTFATPDTLATAALYAFPISGVSTLPTNAPSAGVAGYVNVNDSGQTGVTAPVLSSAAYIDRVLCVPANPTTTRPECLVVAGFNTTRQTYAGYNNGVVRVLETAGLTEIGYLSIPGQTLPLHVTTNTNTANDLRGSSIFKAQETIDNGSDVDFVSSMHYDSVLDCVFIGFAASKASIVEGCCPYLVCQFVKGAGGTTGTWNLVANKIFAGPVPTTAASTGGAPAVGQSNNILTTYVGGVTDGKGICTPFLKTMHLSSAPTTNNPQGTDCPYLISNIQFTDNTAGDIGSSSMCVYATPLVNAIGNAVTPGTLGQAAQVTNPAGPATTVNFSVAAVDDTEVYNALNLGATTAIQCHIPALVGGGPVPASISNTISYTDKGGAGSAVYLANITSLKVVGNTVLVSVCDPSIAAGSLGAQGTAGNHHVGVWASTAIFDQNGVIWGWTPWTRAFGMNQSVYGMHAFANSPMLWTVHQEPNGAFVSGSTLSTIDTGHSMTASADLNNYGAAGTTTLFKQLQSDLGNVTFLKSFQGHKVANLGGMSVMVAAGDNGISLAKTADTRWQAIGLFSSCPLLESLAVTSDNYVHFANSALPVGLQSATIRAVEFSRLNSTNGGYFFFATDNGLFVLNNAGVGLTNKGDNNGQSLGTDGITGAGLTTAWTFNEVLFNNASIKGIKDLGVVGTLAQNYLVVLTGTQLLGLDITTPANFGPANLNRNGVQLMSFSGEVPYSLNLLPSVGSVVNASTLTNNPNGCGILLTSQNIYQLTNIYGGSTSLSNTSMSYTKIFSGTFGPGTGKSVRSVELVPLSAWAAHGYSVSNGVIADLVIVTGDISSGMGSAVYVAPLTGSMTVSVGANGTDDASVFGLTATQAIPPFLVVGADVSGGPLWNSVRIAGVPMISQSSDVNPSGNSVYAGVTLPVPVSAASTSQQSELTTPVNPARLRVKTNNGGDGSVAMIVQSTSGASSLLTLG